MRIQTALLHIHEIAYLDYLADRSLLKDREFLEAGMARAGAEAIQMDLPKIMEIAWELDRREKQNNA